VFALVANVGIWGITVVIEGIAGNHLYHLQAAFKFRFGLFLLREAIFFFAIFWVYLDSAINPSIEVGGQWPPIGVLPLNPFGTPLLNTVVLLSRGVTATYSHYLLLMNRNGMLPLVVTLVLAFIFEAVQYIEFTGRSFSIRDGIYGRIFFFGTGFHGLHVILGHIFLAFNAYRMREGHFTRTRHIRFELALVY
jgi:cytochrome c oxidase subunit 3